MAALGAVTAELRRVLKPTGSLWLNLGDTYRGKRQLGIPWRVAFHLTDEQGWTLRNSVVWHKVKGGPDTSATGCATCTSCCFHFVRRPRGYYYDADAVEARAARGARGERRRRLRHRRERRALPPPDRALDVAGRAREGGGPGGARGDARRGGGRPPRRLPHGHPRPPARDALGRRRRVRPRSRARGARLLLPPLPPGRRQARRRVGHPARGHAGPGPATSRRSRPTSAASPSSPPARRTAWSSTRSAAPARRCWSPSRAGPPLRRHRPRRGVPGAGADEPRPSDPAGRRALGGRRPRRRPQPTAARIRSAICVAESGLPLDRTLPHGPACYRPVTSCSIGPPDDGRQADEEEPPTCPKATCNAEVAEHLREHGRARRPARAPPASRAGGASRPSRSSRPSCSPSSPSPPP